MQILPVEAFIVGTERGHVGLDRVICITHRLRGGIDVQIDRVLPA